MGGRLTAKLVEHAAPGRHSDGGGLDLQVTSKDARSWIYRYVLTGKEHFMGLGSAAAIRCGGRASWRTRRDGNALKE